jgi:hypothetical protein
MNAIPIPKSELTFLKSYISGLAEVTSERMDNLRTKVFGTRLGIFEDASKYANMLFPDYEVKELKNLNSSESEDVDEDEFIIRVCSMQKNRVKMIKNVLMASILKDYRLKISTKFRLEWITSNQMSQDSLFTSSNHPEPMTPEEYYGDMSL